MSGDAVPVDRRSVAAASSHVRVQPDGCRDNAAQIAYEMDLVTVAGLAGFRGSDWTPVFVHLYDYGYRSVRKWIADGSIFSRCITIGVHGPVLYADRPTLTRDDIDELARDVASEALLGFRDRVLATGRWDPTRGTTLRTYFVGFCLQTFVPVYRRTYRRLRLHQPFDGIVHDHDDVTSRFDRQVVDRCDIVDALSGLSWRDRQIVGMWLEDHPHAHTATLLGATPKSIERRWQRIRHDLRDVLTPA